MKQLSALLLLLFATFVAALSQAPTMQWADGFGGTGGPESCRGIAVDTALNSIQIGFYSASFDLNPGAGVATASAFGSQDFFIQKLNSAGQFVWGMGMGGVSSDLAHDVAVNAAGEVFVCGSFYQTVDFDPGPGVYNLTSTAGQAGFLLKLDANGNFVSAIMFTGAASGCKLEDLDFDAAGNIVCTGNWFGTIDFDPGVGVQSSTLPGSNNLFVLKLNSAGNYLWHKVVASNPSVVPTSLDVDQAGNIVVAGYFSGNTDFDPGPATFTVVDAGSYQDLFALKLDTNGIFVWAKSIGGNTGSAYPYTVNVDAWGNIVLGGFFAFDVDFDPGTGTATRTSNSATEDIFILRLTPSGNFRWVAAMGGGIAEDFGNVVLTDNFGYVYSTGYFIGTVDFDPGPAVYNLVSAPSALIGTTFVQKLDSSGNYVWAVAMAGASGASNLGYGLGMGTDKSLVVGGEFAGTVDFDPGVGITNLTGASNYDAFAVKLTQCSGQNTASTLSANVCDNYTLNGQLYSATGTYIQVRANVAGCDSTITLNLIVRHSTAATQSITACDSYTWPANSQTYTTGGVYTATLINAQGCDSVATLNLTVNASTAGSQTETACDSYTWPANNQTYTTGGVYTATLINAQGCDSVATLNLTINPSPAVSLAPLQDTLCSTAGIQPLSGSPSGGSYSGPGVSGSQFDPATAAAGTHEIIYSYTDGNLCSNADTIVVVVEVCIGLENELFGAIMLYPNPNRGTFSISGLPPGSEIEIWSAFGQKVFEHGSDEPTLEISLQDISKGTYMVKIESNGQQTLRKFVVQ